MNAAQKARLKKAGWTVGTTADFLDLSLEELQLVELKLALGELT